MTAISVLNFAEMGVSHEGLRELVELRNLSWLILNKTRATNAGVNELRTRLPVCKIDR